MHGQQRPIAHQKIKGLDNFPALARLLGLGSEQSLMDD
jgi:hypothetical protein